MNIEGAHAIVTGGSRGLGKAIALSLSNRGAAVSITYKSDKAAAAEVGDLISARGGKCNVVQLDLISEASIENFAHCLAEFQEPDILVNNGGELRRPGSWDKLVGSDLDATISGNLTGHLRVIQKIVPSMERRGGVVINIASAYGLTGSAGVTAYAAAKAGLVSVTSGLARELGPKNIRVNSLAPGNFDTTMTHGASPEFKERVLSTIPLGRFGRPEEIGHAVVFLVEADYVTGHVLVLDGGQMLNM
ncbi:SDR family NAD(P)-dependent oxidoreductase [Streptomyces sp. MMBL 11-3]|uniref:SDR family NAD(P)-dependent oxidoreductase n=1 Tax=Streptomyces sp. MMBL 11-3 TaxID=3382639 RepID=UPI0039B40D6F